MLRTLVYVFNLLAWLLLLAAIALAVCILWPAIGWTPQIAYILGSAPVTAFTILAAGILVTILFLALAEKIVWMLDIRASLAKIQEFFNSKDK